MVEHAKRKKFHDKDKYYRLAKEQGFRSRAAFKLTQINRKFNLLQNAKTIIDLCAAPGGWTQVCARSLPNDSSTTILAVDILPIRKLNSKNVITLIGDITTEKCKAAIRSEMQGAGADVVLCDGAPNVGASYDRDAYQQNELALHALKCACEHLRRKGTFVTKLYRSADYSAYLWVAKQFFETVQAVKPSASRSQSAEIFLVCQGYVAPDKIDPRMFDPKCVFEQVDGQATGGGDKAQTGEKAAKMNIFHKEFGKHVRSRNGYDMTTLDASMRNIGSVANFLEGGSTNDPIQMLSDCTGLAFFCHVCKDASTKKDEEPSCNCKAYLNHRLTTAEIKTCLSDLKVLNKADFKGLLMWRDKMRAERKAAAKSDESDASSDEESGDGDGGEVDSDAEEEKVQSEIEELRKKKIREKKRKKKKERELAAKRRRRAAFGMDLNAIDVPDNDKIFSLATITTAGDLEAAREIDLEKVTDDQLFPTADSDDEGVVIERAGRKAGDVSSDDEDEFNYSLEAELDAAYNRYLTNTKDGMAKSGTKMAKRSKKLQKQKAMEEAQEDAEMVLGGADGVSSDAMKYAEMLQGAKDSDDSSDDDTDDDDGEVKDYSDKKVKVKSNEKSEDGSVSSADLPKAKVSMAKQSKTHSHPKQSTEEASNPLIFKLAEESASVKTSRWFSNPLFESIETTARSASFAADRAADEDAVQDFDSDEEEKPKKKRKKGADSEAKREEGDDSLNVDDIIASIPKTDKQKRHEKRLKSIERLERRNARREREAGMDGDFQVVSASNDDDDMSVDDKNMSEQEKKKLMDARALIKAGMGTMKGKDVSGFEVVPSKEQPLPVVDTRKYDSENEDYDSDDYIKTLALGTMILRKSKEKAMVDASYNRYAWNDPQGLPDWFVDDENKHYRPQLPIPPELLEKMRQKVMHLATKPIAKVAEARARKNKMARAKLAAAKKKAEAVANSSDMSEAMKLKAISKAMRGKESSKPGKTYVVSKKGGGSKGGKGIKLVDKREKSDKRAVERTNKKKKFGKKGGLTGSKRRRHHK
ncbi:hypothetical protein HJC23_009865 [Cyclotella cryptica]|uniref:rRNA methyltransferase n=1 Tax=Cyclotella cryptica TaxID=29204 RepID=A0ABD3QC70_9STRA|eukprot:CCRYP_006976-RB/>CCRYP_006976-RB protein AED:0.23 eAED:0.23 QI:175/1/1/1/0.66/0.5/4/3789/1039